MAIGFNLPGVPFRAESNVPDYLGALSRGMTIGNQPKKQSEELLASMLQNKINAAKAKYAMQNEAANLASTQTGTSLNNLKLQQIQNEMAQNKMFQDLMSGRQPQNQQSTPIAPQGIQGVSDYSDNGMPGEGPGVAASASAYDTFPGRRANRPQAQNVSQNVPQANSSIVPQAPNLQQNISNGLSHGNKQLASEGDPNLYHIDQMYDQYPWFRKKLEKEGYKKTQTTKYDPKTGTTTTITTSPSGKTEISTISGGGNGKMPLTNDVKSRMQKVVALAPQVIKDIEDLKNTPSPARIPFAPWWKPDQRNAFQRKVKELSESLAVAKAWPSVLGSIERAEEIINRGDYESTDAYKKALDDVIKKIKEAESNAQETLGQSKENKKTDSDKVLVFNPQTGRLE